MKRLFYLLTAFSVILSSCETKIDIAGPWENLPVVYSILDPYDTIHYVRINRVFSGNESGYEMATHSDSLLYNSDLSVKVFVKNEKNVQIKTIVFNKLYLTKDSLNQQGESVFSVDKHHVYASTQSLPYADDKNSIYTYELEIILPDGKKVTSTCHPLVGFSQKNPTVGGEGYNLKPSGTFGSSFKLPKYSGGVKMKIYFHYYEWFSSDNYERKTVSFPLKMQKADYSKEISMGIKSTEILNRLKEVLSTPSANMIRYPGKIDLEYVLADENYAEHLWRRNGGISGETPPITNIKGGYGLFACKSYLIKAGIKPSATTINTFFDDSEFKNLYGFGSPATYKSNKIDSIP